MHSATRLHATSIVLGGLLLLGCSDDAVTLPLATGGMGGGGAAVGGAAGVSGAPAAAGTAASVGGAPTSGGAGASAGGGAGASTSGAAGAGGVGGAAGGGGAGGGAPEPYACTEFLGPNVTGEWFAAGFESHVDGAKWQVKSPHASLVQYWADPNHKVWLETCQDEFYDCETKSKCEGAEVDRIFFVTAKIDYLTATQQSWEQDTEAALTTLKAKYPKLRHVELMTFVRSPEGQNCGEQTTISPNLDAAHVAVAGRSNGFVTVAPHFVVPDCNVFSGAPHMNPQGNMTMGDMIGQHYAE
jgi:hypothetical protein